MCSSSAHISNMLDKPLRACSTCRYAAVLGILYILCCALYVYVLVCQPHLMLNIHTICLYVFISIRPEYSTQRQCEKKNKKQNRKKKHFILATKTYNFKRIMYLYVCKLNEKRNPTYTLYNTYLDISYRM